ncbi:uncharacterized protein LOC134767027 [Penaeus indicus]|uniref:uncharacterized protein LOC134767027 n=1 Tax=Penaeus indicus TaxID=29960 RepID=UPI00300C5604
MSVKKKVYNVSVPNWKPWYIEHLSILNTFSWSHDCSLYIGSTETARRIQSGWNSWKKITGVACDCKIPDKVKGKHHKLMVRPAMSYGLETVPLIKSQERELEVTEMRRMRYEVGGTRLDKSKHETTREILGIERYGGNIREIRLSWFGHVYRRDEEYVVYRRDEEYVAKRVMSRIVAQGHRHALAKIWEMVTFACVLVNTKSQTKAVQRHHD